MVTYQLGNIHIYSEKNFSQFTLLQEELENNQILFQVPIQVIELKALEEWNEEKLNGKLRIHKNPYNGHEIWKDETSIETVEILRELIIFSKTYGTVIYYKHEDAIYGCVRNRICAIIRQFVLDDSLFGIHSALIQKKSQRILIIGSKNSGKTSSVLNAVKTNGRVFTDELIFVDRNLNVSWLKRFPAITNTTINKYFYNADFHIKGEINSELIGEKKFLVNIDFSEEENFSIEDIDHIYILPINTNHITSNGFKKHIIANNWITGKASNNEVIQVFEHIVNRSEMITISQLKRTLEDIR